MKLVGLMGIFILVVSCAKHEDYYEDVSYYDSVNYKNLKKELKKTDFYCEDEAACPSNVGLMYSNNDGSDYDPTIARCTGFLVDKDIVSTNSHCIPSYLKNPYEDCKNKIAIAFLQNGVKKSYGCKKILTYSDHINTSFDFAFIKIEKTKIEPVKLRQTGLIDEEEIYAMRVSPQALSLGGVLKKTPCKMVMNSLLNLKGTNPFSVTGLAKDCEAVPGNSGSPVFSSNKSVIGILQSKWTEKYLEKLNEDYEKLNVDLPEELPDHFVFTNISCIDAKDVVKPHKKCQEGITKVMDVQEGREVDKEKALELVIQWRQQFSDVNLQYEFEFNAEKMTATTNPICHTMQANSGRAESEFVKQIQIGLKAAVDEDWRISSDVETVIESNKTYNYEINYRYDRFSFSSWTHRESEFTSYRPREDIKFTELFSCEAEQLNLPLIIRDDWGKELSMDQFLGIEQVDETEEEDHSEATASDETGVEVQPDVVEEINT